jgi:hypothetical protein
MSRIPTATSRIPTKTASSSTSSSAGAGGSTSSFTTISRPTSGLSATTSGLTSTRSGLTEPRKFSSTLASASYDADAGSIGSAGSAGITSSASIREFAANTTLGDALSSSSSLRRPTTQQSTLTSTNRSISSNSISAAGEKAAFQVDATITRKSAAESGATSSATSSLLVRKIPTSSGLAKPNLTSTRVAYSSDNDNSSTNSVGSGSATGLSRTTSLTRPSSSRMTNTSALAATVSSALQSVKDISDTTKLVSTRPGGALLSTKTTSLSSTLPKPSSVRHNDEVIEKIPGVSRERQVIMGGKSTAKENLTSESSGDKSKYTPAPAHTPALPPQPPSEQDIDNLDLKTFLSIFTSQSPNKENTFIPSKDLSKKELERIVQELVQKATAKNPNVKTPNILEDPQLNRYVDESDWIIKNPYKIKVSTIWREYNSTDVMENLYAYYDMTKAQ